MFATPSTISFLAAPYDNSIILNQNGLATLSCAFLFQRGYSILFRHRIVEFEDVAFLAFEFGLFEPDRGARVLV